MSGAPGRPAAPRHPLALALLHFDKDMNIGPALRAADAAACAEALVVGRRKLDHAGVTNALVSLPLRFLSTVDDLLAYAGAGGWDLCAFEIDPRAAPLPAFEWPARPLIVIGNEGRGVPERLLSRARIARIPQYGGVECLNAATSAAVALYDFLAKRATLTERRIDGGKFR